MADEPSQVVDDDACDECGHFGALEIAGRQLCPDCISAAGSGCGGSDSCAAH